MVLTSSNQALVKQDSGKDSEIVKIQQMLDSRKRKLSAQFFDSTGRKICALMLPKDKHV